MTVRKGKSFKNVKISRKRGVQRRGIKKGMETWSFSKLDEEYTKRRDAWSKQHTENQEEDLALRKKRTKYEEKLLDSKIKPDEHLNRYDEIYSWAFNKASDKFKDQFDKLEKRHYAESDEGLRQMRAVENLIQDKYVTPTLRANRAHHERSEGLPFADAFENRMYFDGDYEFYYMIDGEPMSKDVKSFEDLTKTQLEEFYGNFNADAGDMWYNFYYNYGYTKEEEDKFGRYIETAPMEQYEAIDGKGLDLELDFLLEFRDQVWNKIDNMEKQ